METKLKTMLFTMKKFKGIMLTEDLGVTTKLCTGVELQKLMRMQLRGGVMLNPQLLLSLSYNEAYLLTEELLNTYGISESALAATFYSSFEEVEGKNRFELFIEQALHYVSTYGNAPNVSEGMARDFGMYLTHTEFVMKEGVLSSKLFTYIDVLTLKDLELKVSKLLESGIALSSEDIDSLYMVIKEYNLELDIDKIKNKELMCYISLDLGKVPSNPVEFVRLLVYATTGNTLLISNQETIDSMKRGKQPAQVLDLLTQYIDEYGIESLAGIYNRFKKLFLALKGTPELNKVINKVNKVSKYAHVPMKENVLGNLTSGTHSLEEIERALATATVYQVIRALNALNVHMSKDYKDSSMRLYKIRNGKTFIKRDVVYTNHGLLQAHLWQVAEILKISLKSRLEEKLSGKTFMIPLNVDYAVPTTAKDFIGILPNGTLIKASGDVVVGIHWTDDCDLDLSAVDATGAHIGWNSGYSNDNITYSGDMTRPITGYGATECMKIKEGSTQDIILSVNNYYGDCNDYKLFVGNKNNLAYKGSTPILNTKDIEFMVSMGAMKGFDSLGCFVSSEDEKYFVATNQRLGYGSVVNPIEAKELLSVLVTTYKNKLRVSDLIELCGGKVITNKEANMEGVVSLAPEDLTLDTFISLLDE